MGGVEGDAGGTPQRANKSLKGKRMWGKLGGKVKAIKIERETGDWSTASDRTFH